MERESIIILMEEFIKEPLKIMECTGKVFTYGLMEENILGPTKMIKSQDLVDTIGQMEDIMKENGEEEREMAMEKLYSKMESSNMECGWKIKKLNKLI